MAGPADANVERRIDALLQGAIDPHVHSGPSIAPRGLDHVELLQQASAAGFAAVVTKDHDYSSVMTAALIRKHFPELKTKIYPSIVLNNVVGGLNPYAVEHTAALGGKIVWLPTLAAENHLRWQAQAKWTHPASSDQMRPVTPVMVLNDDKSVRDDAKEILDIVAKNDMVLASGHLHVSETWIVFEEARRRGVKRLVLTHPEDIVDASLNDVKGIAAMGADHRHDHLHQRDTQRQNKSEMSKLVDHGFASSPSFQRPDFFSAAATSGGMYFSSCFASTVSAVNWPSAPSVPSATTPWPSRKRSGRMPV